jgi:hypothetical protein
MLCIGKCHYPFSLKRRNLESVEPVVVDDAVGNVVVDGHTDAVGTPDPYISNPLL